MQMSIKATNGINYFVFVWNALRLTSPRAVKKTKQKYFNFVEVPKFNLGRLPASKSIGSWFVETSICQDLSNTVLNASFFLGILLVAFSESL